MQPHWNEWAWPGTLHVPVSYPTMQMFIFEFRDGLIQLQLGFAARLLPAAVSAQTGIAKKMEEGERLSFSQATCAVRPLLPSNKVCC